MREQILDLAQKQMMAGGYDGLSFTSIAKELNTTRANLHYHFKNKQSLALEVANHYRSTQFDQIKQLAEYFKDDFYGFINELEALFWAKSKEMGTTTICICAQMAQEPCTPEELKNISCDFYENIENLFEEVFQRAINNKQISGVHNPKLLSKTAHLIMLGAMTAGPHIGSVEQAKEEIGGVFAHWAKGLK